MAENPIFWADGINEGQFASIEQLPDGIIVWRWYIDDTVKVYEAMFRLYFCTNCGHRGDNSIIAKSADGTGYAISQLRNVFFNCGIILNKTK